MNIEIKINLDIYDEWNQEVTQKNQQTFFISQKFLNYHPKNRFVYFNIFVFLNEDLYLIIPAVRDGSIIFSHMGSTYGGIIQFFETDKKTNEAIFSQIKKFLKSKSITEIKFRLPPEIFTSESRNSFYKNIIAVEKLFEEEETYVDISNIELENLSTSGFRRNHIRDIKKIIKLEDDIAIKRISKSSDIEEYYNILLMNLSKHKVKPTHSLRELSWLVTNLPEHIWIDVLTYKSKIVSGIVCIRMNNNVLHYFYGSIDYNFKYQGAIKYLYWQTMLMAKKFNFKYVNFGVDSKFGEDPNPSLKSFKEGFGGIHAERTTVTIEC